MTVTAPANDAAWLHAETERLICDGKVSVMPCKHCGFGIGVKAYHWSDNPACVVWYCARHHPDTMRDGRAR